MCGALAMRLPSGSNSAHEKSNRSLMLTDWAVASSRAPICSATDMNRLLKISNSTGSTSVPTRSAPAGRRTRVSSRCPYGVTVARQPGSTTVVELASVIRAGPSTTASGASPSRRWSGTRRHWPSLHISTV